MNIEITTKNIKLVQFLKYSGVAMSGAEAKNLIKNSKVEVNGRVENAPGKQLFHKDLVKIGQKVLVVVCLDENR